MYLADYHVHSRISPDALSLIHISLAFMGFSGLKVW